ELGIAYDADDAVCACVLRKIQSEMLIERIFTVLEEPSNERLIYDRDLFRSLVVRRRKVASANERHPEILKVVGANTIPRRTSLLARLRQRMTRNQHELAPVVGERVVECKPCSLHSWELLQARLTV